ncbi:MAG: HAD family hydrolase [Planctomycetota bacterium]
MELDGVFMDLYGTLTSGDREAVEETCAAIVRDTGAPLTPGELSIVWGERFLRATESCNGDAFETLFELEQRTLVETMDELGLTVDPEPYARMLVAYWRNAPLQREAAEFLSRFEHPIFIVSNADQADAESVLSRHDIRLKGILTSESARSYKPDRRIFEIALEQTGWRRDRVMHVGDSLHSDVGGALAADIRSGWLNRTHRIHDIGIHEPDHEFADLNAFAAWVNGAKQRSQSV